MRKNSQEGFIVLVGVMLATIILSITMGTLNIAVKEVNFSSTARNTNEASFSADVGVECALYNDKTSINKFPIPFTPTPINSCAGLTPTPTGSGTATTATYIFTLPNIGSSGQCAQVTVVKDNTTPPLVTRITAKGYNIGDGSCNSSNANRVERVFEATIGGLPSGSPPPPPPPPGSSALTVNISGTGSGSVTSSPSGINCGSDCTEVYTDSTIVVLSAAPDASSTFAGWSGAGCSGGTVTVGPSDIICTATFDLSSGNFPTIAGTNTSSQPNDSLSHVVNLPASIASGDLLVVLFAVDGNPTPVPAVTWPGTWTRLSTSTGTSSGDVFEIGYKVATGADVGLANITLTTNNVQRSAHRSYRIIDYNSSSIPQFAVNSTSASSATPNPPSLSPTWGSQKTLWIAVAAPGPGINTSVTGYPGVPFPGSGVTTQSGTDFNGASMSTTTANSEVISVDPGNFTLSASVGWISATVAVQGGVTPPPPPTTYTVTPSAGPNGSISPSTPQTINSGSTTTFTVTPNANYTASVGGTCGGSLVGTTYTTNAITANCTVVASFSLITYIVTPSAGSNGSISPSTPQNVNSGSTTTFTVTPNVNYAASVGGTCGGSLVGTIYTTNAITANCTVSATFTLQSAFPTIASTNSGGTGAVDTTTHAINLPSGITAGDLLIVIFHSDGNPTISNWPAGWNQIYSYTAGTTIVHTARYKVAVGGEANFNLITSGAEQSVHRSYRITGYTGTPASATFPSSSGSATPDSPNLSAPWGLAKNLWIAVDARGQGTNTTTTGYPTNYVNTHTVVAGTIGTGAGLDTATRNLEIASEDPGNFTLSTNNAWGSATIVIQGL